MDDGTTALAWPDRMDTGAAFEREVMRHLDAAYNLARWLARNDADAEDVVQEAVLRAFRFFGGFRGGDARVWLLAIVRNTFYTQRAHAPAAGKFDEFDEAIHGGEDHDDPQTVLLRAADAQSLHAALERLPPEFREVLVLRELEECSYKEIASITNLKIGTVMSRLARARERLQRELAGKEVAA
jgi:RNA polymerase sigma-70 factor (ECF subfamily)